VSVVGALDSDLPAANDKLLLLMVTLTVCTIYKKNSCFGASLHRSPMANSGDSKTNKFSFYIQYIHNKLSRSVEVAVLLQ
jgi:hypothetical protein